MERDTIYSIGDRFEIVESRNNKPVGEGILSRIGPNIGVIEIKTGKVIGGYTESKVDDILGKLVLNTINKGVEAPAGTTHRYSIIKI